MRWYNTGTLGILYLYRSMNAPNMTLPENLLQDGMRAARAGQREKARDLLMQVVQADERNEMAWLWLSGVVDDPEDVRICLQNVLDINPNNERALKGIAWLNAHHPVVESAPVQPATSETVVLNQGSAAVGETIALNQAQVAEVVASAPAQKVYTVDDIEILEGRLPDVENPCPYCGVPTSLEQTKCPKCGKSLTVKSNDARPRSWATVCLTAFGVLNLLGGLFNLIRTVLQGFNIMNETGTDPSTFLGRLLGGLLFLLLYALFVRGLWNQKVWAFVLHLIWLVLYAIALVLFVVLFSIAGMAVYQVLPPELLGQAGRVTFMLIGIGIVMGLIFVVELVITIFAWKDFFGGKVRIITDVPSRSDEEHYNMGLAYKKRGMWYIATREWEMAAAKRPSDPNYRRILGLAYAQMKEYGRALRELREALRLRVNDQQLREDIAFVENMALKELNAQNRT